MAGELQIYTYTTINHVIDGQELTADEFSLIADVDNSINNSTNLAPLCNLILSVTFTTAPGDGETVDVYRNYKNIVSTNSEPVVDSNYKQHYVGSFVPDLVTSAQYLQITGIPLPPGECNFIIHNNTSDTITASSWDLDVQPYTYKPST